MKTYHKILYSISSFNSIRMFIGAISVIYMLENSFTLKGIAFLKFLKFAIKLSTSIISANFIDKLNGKLLYMLALVSSIAWLFLLYLGGVLKIAFLFYFSEVFNAVSVVLFNNLFQAYLIDEYYLVEKHKKFETILSELNKLSFFGMILCSGLGSFLYDHIKENLFLVSSLLMTALLILSGILLPCQKPIRTTKKMNKKHTNILFRKYLTMFPLILPIVISCVYYQVFIQYWQVFASQINLIKSNSYMFGITFYCILLSQLLAGKLLKFLRVEKIYLNFLFIIISLFLIYYSKKYHNMFLFLIGLCVLFFYLRITVMVINANLHKNITKHIRSRFDSYINTTIMLVTSLSLYFLGSIINDWGINSLLLLGIIFMSFGTLFLFFYRKSFSKY